MKKRFYLIDYDHNKTAKKHDKLYMAAANIALKYGCFGDGFTRLENIHIKEFWDGDDCPGFWYFRTNVRVSIVKWYICNRFDFSNQIWNGDFIHGLATTGEIGWYKRHFPTLTWRSNPNVFELLKDCCFGGRLSHKEQKKEKHRYRWIHVPALYLKYDKDSMGFMAGLLASGVFYEKDGEMYIKYNKKHKKYLDKWAIPIEYSGPDETYFLVSPIWGALFVSYMPEMCREKWLNIRKPFGIDIYPPILWKTYVNNKFPTGKIPYLRSRRWIFNHYKSEKGAMKTLEKERVSRNLTELDKRIREVVHQWEKK